MSLSRVILTLLVALLIGGTTLIADDAGAGTTPTPNGGGQGNGQTRQRGPIGAITAIDTTAKTVTVKVADKDPVVYTTNDSTKISIDRKDAMLADLKVGDNAFVKPDPNTPTLALRIGVRRNAPAGGAGGAGGTTPPASK
jgi:hypothetical protein